MEGVSIPLASACGYTILKCQNNLCDTMKLFDQSYDYCCLGKQCRHKRSSTLSWAS